MVGMYISWQAADKSGLRVAVISRQPHQSLALIWPHTSLPPSLGSFVCLLLVCFFPHCFLRSCGARLPGFSAQFILLPFYFIVCAIGSSILFLSPYTRGGRCRTTTSLQLMSTEPLFRHIYYNWITLSVVAPSSMLVYSLYRLGWIKTCTSVP